MAPAHAHDCDHHHGPWQRYLHQLKHKDSMRGRRFLVALLRALSLVFCPGDDIAAIGLQLYGSVSGHAEVDTHETKAILPNPVRVESVRKRQKARS